MKTQKPLAAKKPPVPDQNHQLVADWIADARPGLQALLQALDRLIRAQLSDAHYAIKWSKAYYGNPRHGWCVEVAAYDVSANIVFLNGAKLDDPPELGGETRYIKLRQLEDLESEQLRGWIRQSCSLPGWAWE